MTLDILHEGVPDDIQTVRAWGAQAGVRVYLAFRPVDSYPDALEHIPALHLTIKKTPTRTRLIALVNTRANNYTSHQASLRVDMERNADEDITFLLHGLSIPAFGGKVIEIKWGRGVNPWHTQLKNEGLIVMRVL